VGYGEQLASSHTAGGSISRVLLGSGVLPLAEHRTVLWANLRGGVMTHTQSTILLIEVGIICLLLALGYIPKR
jgi:hypothetical protein